MTQSVRLAWPIRAAVLWVPFAVLTAWSFGASVDDMFITLRHARNLAEGHGLVFDAGRRVEGTTSPPHAVLLSLLHLVPGGHDALEARLLSVAFAALALREGERLGRSLSLPTALQATTLLLMVLGCSRVFASVNGLETSLATWLLTALLVRLVDGPLGDEPLDEGPLVVDYRLVGTWYYDGDVSVSAYRRRGLPCPAP